MYIEGINPGRVFAPAELPPAVGALQGFDGGYGEALAVGTRGKDNLGREYVFQTAPGALVAGDVATLALSTGNAAALVAGSLYNRQLGVVPAAVPGAGYGFWAQVQGAAFAGVRASAAGGADAPAYSSASAGALAFTAAANRFVRGITFTTPPSGAGVFAALINYPTVGTVADTDNNLG